MPSVDVWPPVTSIPPGCDGEPDNPRCKLLDREFSRIADIGRSGERRPACNRSGRQSTHLTPRKRTGNLSLAHCMLIVADFNGAQCAVLRQHRQYRLRD
jgi:hypothetical protein